MSVQLHQLFNSSDSGGKKYLDKTAFLELCSKLNISGQDADLIFENLDRDSDGRINFSDFSDGFSQFVSTNQITECAQDEEDLEEIQESTRNHVWSALTAEAEKMDNKLSDEGKLKWLLSELKGSEQRHLVPILENAVEELLGSLQKLQEEKMGLEESWRREKNEHEKHLKRMEDELDNQVKEVETRMRIKAQEEVEGERKTLQSRMDNELDKVQSHLMLIEKVYKWLRAQPAEQQRDCRLDELRLKLDEAVYENRQLRMSLLDTQTSIALMRSELLQLRNLYEEKCRELSSEREKILEVLQEQDHLSRQLNILQDTNRRLLDSHDALRSTVESSTKPQPLIGLSRAKSGSIIGDYLDLGYTQDYLNKFPEHEEEEEYIEEEPVRGANLRRVQSMDVTFPIQRKNRQRERESVRQSLNQSDSGVSTVRDSYEPDETWDASPREADEADGDEKETVPSSRRGSKANRYSSVPPSEDRTPQQRRGSSKDPHKRRLRSSTSEDSLLESECVPRRRISEIKKQLGIEDKPANWRRNWSTHQNSACGQNGVSPPTPLPRISKLEVGKGWRGKEENDSVVTSLELDETEYESDGPAEQTFRVIFVGDAGVGKSSFALRISKGVFVQHMSSTLGLDFLMRNMKVDNRNVAVQLWDTAGQERFRSITKSYFRKADGVMLLYDCTCEQSFLNVRNWVEDIEKASFQRLPLMIVANKIDLREVAIKSGRTCITRQQGEKLAKSCDTIFMEASAKDGSNVLPALANLIRSMSTNQDLQLNASAMQLSETKPKKGSCCSSGSSKRKQEL